MEKLFLFEKPQRQRWDRAFEGALVRYFPAVEGFALLPTSQIASFLAGLSLDSLVRLVCCGGVLGDYAILLNLDVSFHLSSQTCHLASQVLHYKIKKKLTVRVFQLSAKTACFPIMVKIMPPTVKTTKKTKYFTVLVNSKFSNYGSIYCAIHSAREPLSEFVRCGWSEFSFFS